MSNLQVILLLIGLCGVFCNKDIYEYKEETYLPGYDLKGIERAYREQESRVERPCPVYDMLCIRRYFARHSSCKIAEGPVPDPLYRAEANSYLPAFNVTFTQVDVSLSGLTGTVSEFSVNRKSKLTILTIDYKNVIVKANRVYFRYHRRGQEPAITSSDAADATFPLFSITTVFKGVDHISLANSESVIFMNVLGQLFFGPELGIHPDPTIAPRFAQILSQQQIAQPEAFLDNAPFFAAATIQNTICDFGLKLN